VEGGKCGFRLWSSVANDKKKRSGTQSARDFVKLTREVGGGELAWVTSKTTTNPLQPTTTKKTNQTKKTQHQNQKKTKKTQKHTPKKTKQKKKPKNHKPKRKLNTVDGYSEAGRKKGEERKEGRRVERGKISEKTTTGGGGVRAAPNKRPREASSEMRKKHLPAVRRGRAQVGKVG